MWESKYDLYEREKGFTSFQACVQFHHNIFLTDTFNIFYV